MVEIISQSRRLGKITVAWGDGDYDFALTVRHLIELQEQSDAGPSLILARLQSGAWKVQDVRETIRLGLIGAGMEPSAALKLVKRFVDARPLGESVLLAEVVLSAAIVGVPEDAPVGKPEATSETQIPVSAFNGPDFSGLV